MGISIANSQGGWDNLASFTQERELQNREVFGFKDSKRKGKRELKSHSCSINYSKNSGQSTIVQRGGRGDKWSVWVELSYK